ncbi:hypothetical protein DN069_35320 [Streptacidiphilus pinicola]|uniref:HTH marR-type domain-containing protein n=1 Tax=Streptacidiphilus pinicola TaxID=2219663 RepID=A0A2X0ITT2_9ACTN|nr:MarR family transcriptional regulator [Streptacidiphilus pinicola]RAG80986.1 hypothetical protein DN069_35320 [Streptacidiphilus pinicola]
MPPTDAADPAELAVELHAVLGLLSRRARAATAATELTASQRSVAARLLREGPATTADLARAEFVRPQSMRLTLGALEERGLIARTPHPTDGRQVLVELSEAGRATVAGIMQTKQGWLSSAIAGDLDAGQRAALAAALPVLRALAGTDTPVGDAATGASGAPIAGPAGATTATGPAGTPAPARPLAKTGPAPEPRRPRTGPADTPAPARAAAARAAGASGAQE